MHSSAFLLLCVLSSVQLGFACLPGFQTYYNGWCLQKQGYVGVASEATFQSEKTYCKNLGTFLAIVRNADDNERLRRLTDANYGVFLGLECNMATRNYVWGDGTLLNFTNFASGNGTACDTSTRFVMLQSTGKWYPVPYSLSVVRVCAQSDVSNGNCDDFEMIVDSTRNNTSCYKMVSPLTTWTNAEQNCKNDYSHLLSIHTSQTNDFIRRAALGRGFREGIHIGALATNGSDFVWTDYSPVDYNKYGKGFADPDFGECTAMDTSDSSGIWVSTPCDNSLPYACGRDAYTGPIADQDCPEQQVYKPGDLVYSPGFPGGYSYHDNDCDYFLKVPAGYRVELEIVYMETNTCCDPLYVYDGNLSTATAIYTLSGSNLSGQRYRTTTSNIMRLAFRPTSGVNVRGWHVTFRAV